MISAGYFEVTKAVLERFGKIQGEDFLSEMVNYGGRLSHDGMKYWMSEMGWN